ncbi:MAG: metallophosphoesterase family protein [Thermoplasmata archaeon]
MKFCLASDIHGNIKSTKYLVNTSHILKCNAIILAGDLTAWGDMTSIFPIFNELNKFEGQVISVLGNSDYENEIDIVKDFSNVKILHGNSLTLEHIKIIGVSGIPETNEHGSFFSLPESKILKLLKIALNERPTEKFLLSISHIPPLGILDFTRFGTHAGSKAIKTFIENFNPDVHVCGHIHENPGIVKFMKTTVVNPGLLHKNDPLFVLEINENINLYRAKT